MGETDSALLTPEAVREELLGQIEGLRRDVEELKRMLRRTGFLPGSALQTREERLAGLEELRKFREEVLRRRGGQPLPPSADEIARTREERAAQILGENIE